MNAFMFQNMHISDVVCRCLWDRNKELSRNANEMVSILTYPVNLPDFICLTFTCLTIAAYSSA